MELSNFVSFSLSQLNWIFGLYTIWVPTRIQKNVFPVISSKQTDLPSSHHNSLEEDTGFMYLLLYLWYIYFQSSLSLLTSIHVYYRTSHHLIQKISLDSLTSVFRIQRQNYTHFLNTKTTKAKEFDLKLRFLSIFIPLNEREEKKHIVVFFCVSRNTTSSVIIIISTIIYKGFKY